MDISVRFTVLLPCLALAAWAVIVAVPTVRTYVQLRPIARLGKNATVSAGKFHTTIPPGSFAPFAVNSSVVTRSHALTALNLPGALLEMPVAVALTHPSEWYPKRLDQWTPSLLAMPISCLPAWWLVGLAIDALLGRRRLRWPLALLGCVLCGMFALLLADYVLARTPGDQGPGGWVYVGLGMWIVLFAVLPAAWAVRSVVLRGPRG